MAADSDLDALRVRGRRLIVRLGLDLDETTNMRTHFTSNWLLLIPLLEALLDRIEALERGKSE